MDGPSHDQGPTRRTSLKRSFDQISRSPPPQSSTPPQPAWASHFHQAVQNRSPLSFGHPSSHTPPITRPDPPRFRYFGDGLDLRRPVMSQSFDPGSGRGIGRGRGRGNPQEVIDLTEDSPEQHRTMLPRRRSYSPPFLHLSEPEAPDVIDLESLEALPRVNARPARSPSRREDTPAVDLTGATPIDLEDDDIQFISENRIHNPAPARSTMGSIFNRLADTYRLASGRGPRRRSPWPDNSHQRSRRSHERFLAQIEQSLARNHQAATRDGGGILPYRADRSILSHAFHHARGGFQMPMPDELNFETVAFNYHTGQPSRPTYEAPPAVPEGFTRSPRDDDVLLCPNCDHELGQGEGLERQAWVIRDCGHVYCGVCAGTRKIGNRKATNVPSAQQRPRAALCLDTCVVEACAAKSAGKAKMFQLYT